MEHFQQNRRIHGRIVNRTQKYIKKINSTIDFIKLSKQHFQYLYDKSNDIYHRNRLLSYQLCITWLEETLSIINSLSNILPRSHVLELDSDGYQLDLYNTTINTCHDINSRIDIIYNNQKWSKFINTLMDTDHSLNT